MTTVLVGLVVGLVTCWLGIPVILLSAYTINRRKAKRNQEELPNFEEFEFGHPELWDVDDHEDEFEVLDQQLKDRKERR